MTTQLITRDNLSNAAQILRGGGLCVVPTETVYGLAADGTDETAVRRMYDAKNRPPAKPMPLLVPSLDAALPLVKTIPPDAKRLADAFLPGPLTLVLAKSDAVPDIVTAGLNGVAIRVPDHETTLELLRLCGVPLACSSANLSGSPSAKTFRDALSHFDGKIEAAVDGGDCAVGTESTILDMTVYPYKILRRGGLTKRKIADCLGQKIDGMTVIGITGGSGAGKTTALRALYNLGALTLDCDALYRELTETDAEMLSELNERFPGVAKNGALDRRALAAVVFTDKTALADLNKITHVYVDREVNRRMSEFAANGGQVAAIDAIALFESGIADACDVTAAILAPRETRLKRIVSRDNITEDAAELRLSAQQPDEYYTSICEIILRNEYDDGRGFMNYCEKIFSNILEGL